MEAVKKMVKLMYLIIGSAIIIGSACIAADGNLPTKEQIFSLREQIDKTFIDFIQQSIEVRLGYTYKGDFVTSQDKSKIKMLAAQKSVELDSVLQKQEQLLKEIQDYQDQDWESKFGKTGLFRQLKSDIEKTLIAKIEIDCWTVRTQDNRENGTLKILLERWESLDLGSVGFKKFLLGRIISAGNNQKALSVYDSIDTSDFDANLKKQLLLEKSQARLHVGEQIDVNELEKLALSDNDIEARLRAALMLCKVSRCDVLEAVIKKYPSSTAVISRIFYEEIKSSPASLIENISETQASLAVEYILANGCDLSSVAVIDKLLEYPKFQKGLCYYVGAKCLEELHPAKAVKYFVEASRRYQDNKIYTASQAALDAVGIAYSIYEKDKQYLPLAIESFGNLEKTAPNAFDNKMKYLYAKLFRAAGNEDRYSQLIKELSASDNQYAVYSSYDTILARIEQASAQDNFPPEIASELENLVTQSSELGIKDIAENSAVLLGQVILKDNTSAGAEKIILLFEQHKLAGACLFYKARALSILERFEESVGVCADAVKQTGYGCRNLYEVYTVIGPVVDDIENSLDKAKDPNKLLSDIEIIGKGCLNSDSSDLAEAVVFAYLESAAFAGKWDNAKQSEFDKTAVSAAKDSLAYKRCLARISFVIGNHSQSATQWADIAKYYKLTGKSPQDNLRWWRAKYYQLLSLSKVEKDTSGIKHHIEVLLKSSQDTDNIWAKRLQSMLGQL